MKYYSLLLILFSFYNISAQEKITDLEKQLFNLPDVIFTKINSTETNQIYKLDIKQPVDHKNPEGPYFYQQAILNHRGFDQPTVMNTNGYSLGMSSLEPVQILDANYISIEHRYFGNSIPDSLDWSYLNLYQATSDLHKINQLFKKLYKGKWISSGISKGGQTTIYYRYFYPDDVDISIPYVAPLNKSYSDSRIYEYLDNVEPASCREKVFATQKILLQNKKQIVDSLYKIAIEKNENYSYVGSVEAAFEYAMLEYPFSFWQGGNDCDDFPDTENLDLLISHFNKVVGISLYEDQAIQFFGPHYYQAATEMGYYHLRSDGLEEWIDIVGDNPHATFSPTEYVPDYNPSINNNIHDWMKNTSDDFIFIYGEDDTWSATKAEPGVRDNILYFVVPDAAHGARMSFFSEKDGDKLETFIESRHEIEVDLTKIGLKGNH